MNTDKIYAESIANEYSKKESSKVNQLKKLDRTAKLTADIFAYTFGIVSALVLGVGMCLCMKVIGAGSTGSMVAGVIIGLLGLAGCGVNYPIFLKLREKGKQKYGSDILRLAKEITEEEK